MNSIGTVILASFAVLWVAAGAQQLPRRWFLSILSMSILFSAAIVLAAMLIPFGKHIGGFNGKIYGIFVALEVIAILIVAMLLNQASRKQYLIPVIAFIVGAHFFGMVSALRSNDFWWVGGAMCALPLLTMSILQQEFWAPVVGGGCAIILWLSALRAFF